MEPDYGEKGKWTMYDFVSSFWPFLLLALLAVMVVVLRKRNTFFYWAARILAILNIVFLTWESLELEGYTLGNFFTQNILTSIPLLIILVVAWRYDLVGAVGFFLAGVFFLSYFEWGDFPIGVVPIFIGILFAVSWLKRQKKSTASAG